MRRRLTLVFTLALTGLAVVGRAQAATFKVTNTNNSGTGSLRAAIQVRERDECFGHDHDSQFPAPEGTPSR